MSAFADWAEHMVDLGYSPVPIMPGQKRPLEDGWDRLRHRATTSQEIGALVRRHPGLGLGVAGGYNGLVPVDVDTDDAAIRAAIRGALPTPLVAKRGAAGATAFFRDPTGEIRGCKFRPPAVNGVKQKPLVEILVTGQTVIPPTIHPDLGRPYRYTTSVGLLDVHAREHPIITPEHIEAVGVALRPFIPEPKKFEPAPTDAPEVSDKRMLAFAKTALANEAASLRAMQSGRNDGLFRAVCTLGRYVRHGVLSKAEVEKALIQATIDNGYTSKLGKGLKAAQATFDSAFDFTANDSLPALPERERPLRFRAPRRTHHQTQPGSASL
jgi:Bifunctional DNA primase/polymerase, N-terminal